MSSLVPCPGCDRHVNPDESACPFRQAALASEAVSVACTGALHRATGRRASAARR